MIFEGGFFRPLFIDIVEVDMNTKEWTLTTCSNQRLTCDNYSKNADEIIDVLKLLEKKFNVDYVDGSTGADMVALSLLVNGEKVKIGYDIWSGIFIMSETINGDCVIQEIQEYLNNSTLN